MGASGTGSASASVQLNLNAPVGAGVRCVIICQRSGLGGWPLVFALGSMLLPDSSGRFEFETTVPVGGVGISIHCGVDGFIMPSTLAVDATWSYPGVTPGGAATPGCLGPAVDWTQGIPRIGNANFGFSCVNAHPFLGAVSVVGLGDLQTPILYDHVNIWIDPSLPMATAYFPSSAAGAVFHAIPLPNHPSYLGLVLCSQFIVFEPNGCMPLNLSGSNSVRAVIQS